MRISSEFQLDVKHFLTGVLVTVLVQLTSYSVCVQSARIKAYYNYEEALNPEAQRFYDMLKSVDTSLYEGCTKYSHLSAMSELYVLLYKQKGQWVDTCSEEYWLMFEVVGDSNKGHVCGFGSQSGAITTEQQGSSSSSSIPSVSSKTVHECCIERNRQ
ncbi:hypothetical protein M9H77_27327 [Catharanthus roseus]|uniref:Uncharacterized protein n=1 Tax=Catharanthus roseus TaxID=4058 RepID=A0ACC0AD19_CATRO|nr:hypothetical protein M9H77_27327 [Catharanthus roseus]